VCRHGDVKSFPPDVPIVVPVFMQKPFIRSRSGLISASVAVFCTFATTMQNFQMQCAIPKIPVGELFGLVSSVKYMSRRNTSLFFVIVYLSRTHSRSATFVTLYSVLTDQGAT